MTAIYVALDAMSGDHGVSVVIPAAIQMLKMYPELHLVLTGDEKILHSSLKTSGTIFKERLIVQHASQQVAMDEAPAIALRTKKDSSMRVAIDLVKSGKVKACVSAGNTGALMATARYVLKMLPGIDRPAIMARIPTMTHKSVRILDLGANVDSTPEHLLQFAVMGSVVTQATTDRVHPKVALLNIGHEDIKGNELVKQTAVLLRQQPHMNYVGYVEADEVFRGNVDVVVCDGFVGNVALKASEGMARLMAHFLKTSFGQGFLSRLAGIFALPAIQRLRKQMDPARYNGASLLGLQGIVIKSHGGTNVTGFARAIEEAMLEIQHDVPQLIRNQVKQLLNAKEPSGDGLQ